MDVILITIALTTLVFVGVQIWLFLLTGSYMDTLVQMWFTYILGECGVMGAIKVVKELRERQKIDEEKQKELDKKQKQVERKQAKALAAMKQAEEGLK